MKSQLVVQKLKKKYPNKKIIYNNKVEPTEILCEIEPTEEHEEWSEAIAVIDSSIPHVHRITVEEYEVLDGELIVFLDGKKHVLRKGQSVIIHPGTEHYALGKETWIKVTAKPGWKIEDHILLEAIKAP